MFEDAAVNERKIAIVGSAETSRSEAPYDDHSWEIWTLNDMCLTSPRIDRLFEIHSQRILEQDKEQLAEELEWLRNNTQVEVWMTDPPEWVPMARQYPTEAIIKEFGRYFTNTVSYMIALALHEGCSAIGIWGVDMAHGTEYAAQRPSCEYFIGLARGRGVDVYIPPQSDLLAIGEMYGMETSQIFINLANRKKELLNRRNIHTTAKVEAMLCEARIDGAIEILDYTMTWDRRTQGGNNG